MFVDPGADLLANLLEEDGSKSLDLPGFPHLEDAGLGKLDDLFGVTV